MSKMYTQAIVGDYACFPSLVHTNCQHTRETFVASTASRRFTQSFAAKSKSKGTHMNLTKQQREMISRQGVNPDEVIAFAARHSADGDDDATGDSDELGQAQNEADDGLR